MKRGAFHPGPNANPRRAQDTVIRALVATYTELAATPLTDHANLARLRAKVRAERSALNRWILLDD